MVESELQNGFKILREYYRSCFDKMFKAIKSTKTVIVEPSLMGLVTNLLVAPELDDSMRVIGFADLIGDEVRALPCVLWTLMCLCVESESTAWVWVGVVCGETGYVLNPTVNQLDDEAVGHDVWAVYRLLAPTHNRVWWPIEKELAPKWKINFLDPNRSATVRGRSAIFGKSERLR